MSMRESSMVERLEDALQAEWDRQAAQIYWWDPADSEVVRDGPVEQNDMQRASDGAAVKVNDRIDRKSLIRALLEAMREPTPEMMDAANDFWIGQSVRLGTIRLGWQDMIDAALMDMKS